VASAEDVAVEDMVVNNLVDTVAEDINKEVAEDMEDKAVEDTNSEDMEDKEVEEDTHPKEDTEVTTEAVPQPSGH